MQSTENERNILLVLHIWSTHIDPMLARKDGHQFRVLIECTKVFLIVDFGAIGVQMDCWLLLTLVKFLGHLGAYFLQACGANGFFNVARDVLDLAARQ